MDNLLEKSKVDHKKYKAYKSYLLRDCYIFITRPTFCKFLLSLACNCDNWSDYFYGKIRCMKKIIKIFLSLIK